jgi:serine/threonine protein kinase
VPRPGEVSAGLGRGHTVARERLRREARAAAALDHPFICKVYQIADADDRAFIVMEYVEGDTLRTPRTGG